MAMLFVPIEDDFFLEEDEDFEAEIIIPDDAGDKGVMKGPNDSADVTILDSPPIEVNFSPTSYEVNEEDGTATLIIVADKPSSEPYTVNVVTSDGTAEG